MKYFFLLALLFFAQPSFSKGDSFDNIKIQNEFMKESYENFLSGKGYVIHCTRVFWWLGVSIGVSVGSEPKENASQIEEMNQVIHRMQAVCVGTLMGLKTETTGHELYRESIEAAVDKKLISEDIYLYFVHSLAVARWVVGSKPKPVEDEAKAMERISKEIDLAIKESGVGSKYVPRLKARYEKFKGSIAKK